MGKLPFQVLTPLASTASRFVTVSAREIPAVSSKPQKPAMRVEEMFRPARRKTVRTGLNLSITLI
jgi:hypothetical protein